MQIQFNSIKAGKSATTAAHSATASTTVSKTNNDSFESVKVEAPKPAAVAPTPKKKSFWQKLFGGIKKVFSAVGNAFKALGEGIASVAKTIWKGVTKFFDWCGDLFTGRLFKKIGESFLKPLEYLIKNFNKFKSFARRVFENATNTINGFNKIKAWLDNPKYTSKDLKQLGMDLEKLKGDLEKLKGNLEEAREAGLDGLSGFIDSTSDFIDSASQLLDTVIAMQKLAEQGGERLSGMAENLEDFFQLSNAFAQFEKDYAKFQSALK